MIPLRIRLLNFTREKPTEPRNPRRLMQVLSVPDPPFPVESDRTKINRDRIGRSRVSERLPLLTIKEKIDRNKRKSCLILPGFSGIRWPPVR